MKAEETVIAEWFTDTIPRPYGDDTVESITRAMFAGLFYTAAKLIEHYDIDAAKFREVEKITLSLRTLRWDKEFILRLTKAEHEKP